MRSLPFMARLSARAEASLSTHAFTYLFKIMYVTAVVLMFMWGFRSQFEKEPDNTKRWYISIARGAGYTLNINTALVILLASRLFLTALRDTALANLLPLDKSFPSIHILVAYFILAGVVIHVPFHLVWIIRYDDWDWGLWQVNMTVITGILLLTVFLVMFLFARPLVRKKSFIVFYYIHIIGAFFFFALLIIHGMYFFRPETYKYVTPPLIVYAIDRLIRRIRASTHNLELSAEHSVFKDGNILKLSIPKPFTFRPGQYAEIKVPSINHEWHPFTIASAQYEPNMSFFIKSLGDWTKDLHSAFQQRLDGMETDALRVQVRGPYGAPCQEVTRYQRVLMISGGIGATPFMSICKQIQYQADLTGALLDASSQNMQGLDEKIANLSNSVEERIRNAVSEIYDVQVSGVGACEGTKGQHVADMLRVTAGEENFKSIASKSGDESREESKLSAKGVLSSSSSTTELNGSDSEDFAEKDRTFKEYERARSSIVAPVFRSNSEKEVRRRTAHLTEVRSNLLRFLHATRVSFTLLILAVARMAVVISGSIFSSDFVELDGVHPNPPVGRWVVIAYAALTVPICISLFVTVLVEASLLRARVFSSFRRILDTLVFGAATVVSLAFNVQRAVQNRPGGTTEVIVQFGVVQFVVFVLLCQRMWRSIGRKGLLEGSDRCSYKSRPYGNQLEADFVWTTPYSGEDLWLRRELGEVSEGSTVRLHRYVTRGDVGESAKNLADIEAGVSAFADVTTKGRPEWDNLLASLARSTSTDGVIGIFFCGPHPMGAAVRESAKRVEMWSNLRDAYLRTVSDRTLMNDLGVYDSHTVKRLRRLGCRVRFVYREENFS